MGGGRDKNTGSYNMWTGDRSEQRNEHTGRTYTRKGPVHSKGGVGGWGGSSGMRGHMLSAELYSVILLRVTPAAAWPFIP